MSREPGAWARGCAAWLNFWFAPPPRANLAFMRIGVGLLLLYALFVRSFDLEALFSATGLGSREAVATLDTIAWSFSVFDWVEGPAWLWFMHALALVTAAAFALGIAPSFTGGVALALHLSYAHHNPAIVLGLDGLITMGLIYLVLMPSGARLSVPGGQLSSLLPRQGNPSPHDEPPAHFWSGIPLRALQIHLCLLYLHSGLAKLNGQWLDGIALWHPRLVEKGTPFSIETLEAAPALLAVLPVGLALFELFYGVFVWLPGLRHVTLAAAVVVHLCVGILWDKLPFNLLMIVLNLAFLRAEMLDTVARQFSLASAALWRAAFVRGEPAR